jgi:aminoglycoside phosphotransferase (APT) family kinase protein
MVGLFLNGGVTEVEFHDSVAPLARRALAALPRPVSALPTGEFVHSDFTLRNMLFHDGRLSAVVDIEGFGQGTRATDLVSLLQTATHPGHGSPPATQRVVEHAIAAAGADGFVTCVVHRVLASLAWASDHPVLLPDAKQRATGLLDLVS